MPLFNKCALNSNFATNLRWFVTYSKRVFLPLMFFYMGVAESTESELISGPSQTDGVNTESKYIDDNVVSEDEGLLGRRSMEGLLKGSTGLPGTETVVDTSLSSWLQKGPRLASTLSSSPDNFVICFES